jgi:hypothetical protein
LGTGGWDRTLTGGYAHLRVAVLAHKPAAAPALVLEDSEVVCDGEEDVGEAGLVVADEELPP